MILYSFYYLDFFYISSRLYHDDQHQRFGHRVFGGHAGGELRKAVHNIIVSGNKDSVQYSTVRTTATSCNVSPVSIVLPPMSSSKRIYKLYEKVKLFVAISLIYRTACPF